MPEPVSIGCHWEKGNWRSLRELRLVKQAVTRMADKLGGPEIFKSAMAGYMVNLYRISSEFILGHGAYSVNNAIFPNAVFNSTDAWAKEQVTHELAHVWDTRQWLQLSYGMMYATGSHRQVCSQTPSGKIEGCVTVYDANMAIEEAPTDYAKGNSLEDWAESFTVFIYPSYSEYQFGPIRKDYIKRVIQNLP